MHWFNVLKNNNKLFMVIKRLLKLEKYKDYFTLLYTKYSKYFSTLNLVTPLLIFLGFSALSISLYIRFIRERLPKDIPFVLYEYSFFILVGICCIYAYVIFRLLIPQKTIHPLMLKGLYLMFLPIYNLDAFIKYNRYIYPYYFKLFSYACKILDDWYFKHLLRAIYILQILPRIILVSIFITDIFYFAQLKLIYSFIYIGILPLFYAYIKYSIVVALEAYTQQLESQYTRVAMREKDNPFPKDASAPPAPHNDYGIYTQEEFETLLYEHRVLYGVQNPNAIYHEEEVSIRRYIEIQYETWYNYDPKDETTQYEYTGSPYPQEEVYITYRKNNNKVGSKLTYEDYDTLEEPFHTLMPNLLILNTIIITNKKVQEYKQFKYIKLVIYIAYLVGWVYILYISLDSLQDLPTLKKVLEIVTEYIKLYRNGGRRII